MPQLPFSRTIKRGGMAATLETCPPLANERVFFALDDADRALVVRRREDHIREDLPSPLGRGCAFWAPF